LRNLTREKPALMRVVKSKVEFQLSSHLEDLAADDRVRPEPATGFDLTFSLAVLERNDRSTALRT
jgi:hypothetical protein